MINTEWVLSSWAITPCSPLINIYVSEEHVTFIIRVEEEAKQETSKQTTLYKHCRQNLTSYMMTILDIFVETLKWSRFSLICNWEI
jgi:hypothetical protein